MIFLNLEIHFGFGDLMTAGKDGIDSLCCVYPQLPKITVGLQVCEIFLKASLADDCRFTCVPEYEVVCKKCLFTFEDV